MPISVATESTKSTINNWQSALPLLLVITVSLAVTVPMIVWGIPSNRDLANHFRFALPFYDAIVSGDAYPGWLAESNGGYGDPSFRFYPPGLYYLLAAARFVIGNWYDATIVTFVALSIVSGLGTYFWARCFMASETATWAGMFYALAPYHVNQLYQAVMLAEWAGAAVLPFVFGFVDRVCERGKPRDIAGLAATYGLLIFTHLPLAVIGSIALLVYASFRIQGRARIQKFAKLSLAAVLGLSVSAVYWVTMVAELRWIKANEVASDSSTDYRNNFLLSTFSPDNLNVWWMNIIALITLMLFAPALLLVSKNARSLRRVTRPVIALTLFALFMSLPLSRPVWSLLKPLQDTQFPWRWLVLISMAGSLLAAAALPLLPSSEKKSNLKRIAIFGAMAISLAFMLSHVIREAQYFSPVKFANMVTDVRGSPSIDYWLPMPAQSNARKMTTEVEAADRAVNVTSWQSEHRKFSVAAGPATEARIRTFYYPHWTAMSEAGVLITRPDKDGALLISLPQNATSIELDFREPPKTKISTISSLSGLIIIGALAVPFRRRRSND
jgi:uncharacterized membrane protein